MASAQMSPVEPGGTPSPIDLLDTSQAGPVAIRGGTLRVGAFFAGTLAGVASFGVLARHLGVDDIGRYSIAIALVTFVGGLSDLGLTTIGVRELAVRGGDQREGVAQNLLGVRLCIAVVGGLAMVGFAAVAGYGLTLVEGVALGAVGLLFQTSQSTLSVPLITDLRLGWVAAFDLLRALLSAALIVVLVLAGAHLLAFLAVTIPVGLAILALNALVVRGRIPLLPKFQAAAWRDLFGEVIPYAVAVAAAALYFQLALIVVSLIANAHAIGYFGVSSRTIQMLLAVPGLAVGTAFPIFARAARDDRERLAYALRRVFEASLLLGALISLLLAVGASLVIKVVGGPKFGPAAELLAIQGIGLGASFSGAVWSYGLLSLGRYRDILRINLLALLLGGATVAVLAALDGARGAAIGTAVGEIVLALLNAFALSRADRDLRPPLRIVPAVAIALGLGALATLAHLPVLAACALAGGIYLVTVLVLGAVPEELVQQVRRG
ncbi:MAG: oligosaccharide flippase family protein [Gaiellaceae bacterium]